MVFRNRHSCLHLHGAKLWQESTPDKKMDTRLRGYDT
jgi:hypothetical protein